MGVDDSLCSRLSSVLCVFISGFLDSVLFRILYLVDSRLHLACVCVFLCFFFLPYPALFLFPFPYSFLEILLCCLLFLCFLPILLR